ncbi:MAG: DUF3566 domain-containing protein [Actinomycetota bacterium]
MDREEASRKWRTDPETTTSGGHLASNSSSGSGPLFDALDAPLPSEIESQRRVQRRQEEAAAAATAGATEVLPQHGATTRRRRPPPRERRSTVPVERRGRRIGARRVKRSIKHVQPFSVLKLSLLMYTVFLVLWLIFVAVLYSFVDSAGLFETLEDFGRGMVLWDDVEISLGLVERWAFFVGLGFVVVGSLVNLFLAFMYNVISDVVGGIELTFSERD